MPDQSRRRRLSAIAVAAGAALLASCSSAVEPSSGDLGSVPAGAFTTDATGYTAYRLPGGLPRYQFRLVSRFQNQGAATVYLGRCFPESPTPLFSVVSTTAAESGYAQPWACVGHDQQFAIRPGEARVDTLLVQGPNMFEGGTSTPIGVSQGNFRLYYDVRLAPGDGAPPAPDAITLSNAFRVRTSEDAAP